MYICTYVCVCMYARMYGSTHWHVESPKYCTQLCLHVHMLCKYRVKSDTFPLNSVSSEASLLPSPFCASSSSWRLQGEVHVKADQLLHMCTYVHMFVVLCACGHEERIKITFLSALGLSQAIRCISFAIQTTTHHVLHK